MIDLSILICSTNTRWKTFGTAIQKQVWEQYDALPEEDQKRIEIIMLTDNKKMMLGEKRNVMVDMAQGEFVQFIDDDDRIEPDMFASILQFAGHTDCDVITFLASVSLNGQPPKICRYSTSFTEDRNTEDGYERLPNHICAVRRSIARQVSFPNIAYGEDSAYSKLLLPLLNGSSGPTGEIHIPRVLYHYDWSEHLSETQEHRPGQVRERQAPPLVDVVMLSKARYTTLAALTQSAIDSCLAGANSLPINITVLESHPGVHYERARTIYMGDYDFNYNAFANHGASMGLAPWIVVANNDLVFRDGWLHQLLIARHDVVSPKCIRRLSQADVIDNEMGYDNGRHFSGWCFMISRKLWMDLGGLDETFNFWCSDDAVIEQLKELGVKPMIVPSSLVEHISSSTLYLEEHQDSLTWANVKIFNEKFRQTKFHDDKRYQEFLERSRVAEINGGDIAKLAQVSEGDIS